MPASVTVPTASLARMLVSPGGTPVTSEVGGRVLVPLHDGHGGREPL
jgi:hypothetical protein